MKRAKNAVELRKKSHGKSGERREVGGGGGAGKKRESEEDSESEKSIFEAKIPGRGG